MPSGRTGKRGKLAAAHGPELNSELLDYVAHIDEFNTPDKVLDRLHKITSKHCDLGVLGAALFPIRWGDWGESEVGKNVFLHGSVDRGWWNEYQELIRKHLPPGLMMAQIALAPFTMSESMRMLEPLGVDRWPRELALKYGMRDRLTCPVGGRWVVVFWSRNVLCDVLSEQKRAMLFMGATFAAIRLQQLVGDHTKRVGKGASLTPRELSVLWHLSVGKRVKDIAQDLHLGEETVRSHLKKAQVKLGVHDRTHAVAHAIRLRLIA
jgi:LuxR family quorum sensing-dependent transcriptional regulator